MILLAVFAWQASLVDLLPPQPLAIAACERPVEVVEALRDGEVGRRLRAGPLMDALESQPGWGAAMLGWSAISAPTQGDAAAFARALMGGGVALALAPGAEGAPPGLVAIARLGDADAAEEILGQAARLAQIPPRNVRGEEWELPLGAGALMRRGELLAFASTAELATAMRARLTTASTPEAPEVREGLERVRARGASAWLWAQGAALRANGFAPRPEQMLVSLLTADLHEALRLATWVGVTLDCDAGGVRATLLAPEPAGLAATHAPFRAPTVEVPVPRLPGALLRGVVRRDVGGWYVARDLYVAEAAVAASIEADGNYRVLFGRDFGPDVLAWLEPAAVLVAARNPDAATRALELELPAGALGVRLKADAPADLPQGFVNAFMAAVTFANFQAGAADENHLLLDVEVLPDGGKLYLARRRALAPGVTAPLAHNLELALAMRADGEIWIASSIGMMREILAAPRDRATGGESFIEVDLRAVPDLLDRARGAIVARRLLVNGGDLASAELFASGVRAGAGLLDGARLRAGVSDGLCFASVEIHAQPE